MRLRYLLMSGIFTLASLFVSVTHAANSETTLLQDAADHIAYAKSMDPALSPVDQDDTVLAMASSSVVNQILTQLLAQKNKRQSRHSLLSVGPEALLLMTPDGHAIPFFTFVHLYHAQSFVHECLQPLILQGDVTLQQLHHLHTVLSYLAALSPKGLHYRGYGSHHCNQRVNQLSKKWWHQVRHSDNGDQTVQRFTQAAMMEAANTQSVSSKAALNAIVHLTKMAFIKKQQQKRIQKALQLQISLAQDASRGFYSGLSQAPMATQSSDHTQSITPVLDEALLHPTNVNMKQYLQVQKKLSAESDGELKKSFDVAWMHPTKENITKMLENGGLLNSHTAAYLDAYFNNLNLNKNCAADAAAQNVYASNDVTAKVPSKKVFHNMLHRLEASYVCGIYRC